MVSSCGSPDLRLCSRELAGRSARIPRMTASEVEPGSADRTDTQPLRFLFAMFQGGGNIPLIMPIVARLVARGHLVRVLAGPGIRPSKMPISDGWMQRIRDAGAEYVPFSEPEANPFDSAPPLKGVAFTWMPDSLRRMAATQARTTLWSSCWAANVSTQLRQVPTDILVSDFCLHGALAAGEAAQIPCAVIVHNAFHPHAVGQPAKDLGAQPAGNPFEKVYQAGWQWAYDRIWARNGAPFLNLARADLGLPAIKLPSDQYKSATKVLILGSREFDFPARLAANVRYVGTPIDDANVSADTWSSPWGPDEAKPLVLVSLSTLNQGQTPVLHRILEALDGMQLHAVVTVGPSLDKQQFKAPPNAVLETFVPHSAVLSHVDAMITQCGLGSLTKALLHGVPLVCVPVIGEQADNAARVEAKGAGIRLNRDASSAQIRGALTKVLTVPSYREAAGSLAAKMVGSAEDVAADELESLTRTHA
jgi:MGT family glycosyltransferase